MNIGDRVRLLHSKEEGVITKFLKGDVIEVEIEEGFRLPVMKRELAVVSKTEGKFFKPQNTSQVADNQSIIEKRPMVKAEKGIFLAFVPLHDGGTGNAQISLHIINNTDWDLPFSLTTGADKTHRGLAGGYLKAKSFHKIPVDLAMKDFDEWGTFTFSAFYHTYGFFIAKEPFIKKMRVRANTFFTNKKIAPLLEKEAYVFQLDAEDKPLEIDAHELKNKMLEKNVVEFSPKQFEKPAAVVDLHIEKLSNNFMTMNNVDMISLQLKTFENQLEQAIASGMDEITFIHGVGNGVLRDEIHRILSKHKNVGYFQDAQKEKFGYGATNVKIK